MKVIHLNEQLSAYLDGETNLKETKEIKSHLEKCTRCKELLESFQKTRSASLEMRSFPTPPFFSQKVMANYQDREKVTFWDSFDFLPRPIIHGVLIVSIIIVTILSWSEKQKNQVDEDLPQTADYTSIFDESWTNGVLVTNDQALQFTLNNGLDVFEGEPK